MQIVVLGMHRSGTSVLMNVLHTAGCYVGEEAEMLPTNDANPQGYWERLDVVDVNKKMLESVGLDWMSIGKFNLEEIPETIHGELAMQGQSIVENLNEHGT